MNFINSYKNILVYQHLYKNGGSTVWERYKHNACSTLLRFPMWDMPTDCVRFDENKDPYNTPFNKEMKPYPQFIHGRLHPGLLEDNFIECNPIYTTTLREPIARIMSAYNFFMSDVWYKWGNEMHIDFKLWFLNAYTILPTRYESQDEWFLIHTQTDPIAFNYCRVETYRRFDGRSFGMFEGEKERRAQAEGRRPNEDAHGHRMTDEEARELEEQNCEKAFNIVKKVYKHVFFLDDPDRLKKIDKLFIDYEIPVKPDMDVNWYHTTENAYGPMQKTITKFEDLSDEYQAFAYQFLEYEIQFYNKCKNEYT